MKNLVFITVSLIVSFNLAFASDLLFKATNGTLSENSLGVKKLSDEEMKKVKGGLTLQAFKDTTYRDNFGQIIYSLFWRLNLSESEKQSNTLHLDNGVNAFHNYMSFYTHAKIGTPVIQVKYSVNTGNYYVHFATMSPTNQLYYSADNFAQSLIKQVLYTTDVLHYTQIYSRTRAKRY